MLRSDESRNLQLNIRINEAEKKMMEALCKTYRPRVTISKMLIFLCEEQAREHGLIQYDDEGNWTISE